MVLTVAGCSSVHTLQNPQSERWRGGRLDLPLLAEIEPRRCNMTIGRVKIDLSDHSVQLQASASASPLDLVL